MNNKIKTFLYNKIENENGFTATVDGKLYIGNGYAIAVTNNQGSRLFKNAMENALTQLEEKGKNSWLFYLGGEKKRGLYYIDLVRVTYDLADALIMAIESNQEYVYSFKNKKRIKVNEVSKPKRRKKFIKDVKVGSKVKIENTLEGSVIAITPSRAMIKVTNWLFEDDEDTLKIPTIGISRNTEVEIINEKS